MTTTIHSNGSKWAGEKPDPVERLLERLKLYTLDPRFERCGNFISKSDGIVHFWGNFFDVSGVFQIDTDEAPIIERLTRAIRDNQARASYLEAKAGCAVEIKAGTLTSAYYNQVAP